MKRQAIVYSILSASLISLSEGCREKDDRAWAKRGQAFSFSEENPDWDEQEWETPPDTERTPPPIFDPDYTPDTLPSPGYASKTFSTSEKTMYATDVVMLANCQQWSIAASVAKNHAESSTCENIVPIAAQNDHGDFYEVGLPFTWTVFDPTVISLEFPLGTQNNFAVPIGLVDVFDEDDGNEPNSEIRACAQNICPTPRPIDCEDQVCASVTVSSVANVEGAWDLNVETQTSELVFLQDGHTLTEASQKISAGTVLGKTVTFQSAPYIYTGLLTPSRTSMSGSIHELATSLLVGSWSATRSAP